MTLTFDSGLPFQIFCCSNLWFIIQLSVTSVCLNSEIKMIEPKDSSSVVNKGELRFATNSTDVLLVATRLTDNKLDDTNFFEWSKTVHIYLRSIGKASHLTFDPPTDESKDQWLQNDARLFLQIRNSIDTSVISLINHYEYVKELMDC
ncbi:hypothetical protein HanRHA438_Chr02g0089901 [Helianthus annuus]|nr:hypothetical protein HanIR_Chr02g0091441 [Helianthus annuus]KAJ0941023.1 hypothetical protein HanRHA438_Chr02g0089901 [Helianthus annuus]